MVVQVDCFIVNCIAHDPSVDISNINTLDDLHPNANKRLNKELKNQPLNLTL